MEKLLETKYYPEKILLIEEVSWYDGANQMGFVDDILLSPRHYMQKNSVHKIKQSSSYMDKNLVNANIEGVGLRKF